MPGKYRMLSGKRLPAATVAVGICAALLAQGAVLELDPARTQVEFTLGDVLHTVHGTFRLKRGSIQFDPSTGEAGGEAVVGAASGSSGSAARDRRMHRSILESDRYPEIAFRPDRVEGAVAPQGASQVKVHGMFSIHGADHEITAPATVEITGGQAAVTMRFAVPYVKWGMKNPSTLLLRVSDRVDITVHATASLAAAGT
jgi:polyisoprenoid-binding protein YceI